MAEYFALKSALAEDKLDSASASYRRLLSLYDDMNRSGLASVQKEMAYQQILNAHEEISQFRADQGRNSTNYVAIAVVLIIVSTVIFVNPNLVGLAVLNARQTVDLNVAFIESSRHALTLKAPPASVMVSGKVTGHGRAQLYVVAGSEKRLVFDNQLVPLVNGTSFSDICLDTCQLSNVGTDEILLVAELTDTILSVDSLTYDPDTNRPPEYSAPGRNIVVDGTTTLNLRDYFSDPDSDTLAFVALPVDGLDTQLIGAMLTISPRASGNYDLPIIASDPRDSTRVILGIRATVG
ncbi:hypothetical protein HY490_00080 [Candidatus Woesearchaeota archaeon]|nr:hypothetical protein [Candidatus Woesearchaeota archaeon]